MLVDEIGDIIVTNDGATILRRLEIEHPAAKILVDLAKLQDDEIGDGTTSVVVLASELLKRANGLIQNKLHPNTVIAGYRMAAREAVRYIRSNLTIPNTELSSTDVLKNIAITTMSSKIIGLEADHFAAIVVDAVHSVKTVNDIGDVYYPVKAISILKQHGRSARESTLVDGFALNCTRASQAMPISIANAKIALLDIDLRMTKMKLGVQIIIDDPNELEAIRRREIDITKERVQKMLAAGANVILTTKGIDDVTLKYLVEAKVIGVRRCKLDDLKRIAKATGGKVVASLASTEQEGEETFEASLLGTADLVMEERFADDECIIIKGGARHTHSSIILRGANGFMLDEMERSVNDALQAVKRTLESAAVVPGGGAVEADLNLHLENFARTLGTREQLAIAEFAEALLVIPKQLAINAALDAMDLVAKLRLSHHKALKAAKEGNTTSEDALNWRMGLDLVAGEIRNSVDAGVLEPSESKVKSIQFATEAAISILRIDDVIQLAEKDLPVEG
eukprot:TRINITY_DN1806_c0_g1_i1.p1 TRINITY_DN1806_c0_g1~~TRINITY_DN1806_c0_g1_i1.p1  ORF type:complete len:567 (+),score=148.12 TRINITY_DN1806_c0_g1_i1:172-1701(+)